MISLPAVLLLRFSTATAGGMPDLLLWKPAEHVCKLSEVKGPRDRLSDQQRAWLMALASAELEVSERCTLLHTVAHVCSGLSSMRIAARPYIMVSVCGLLLTLLKQSTTSATYHCTHRHAGGGLQSS